MFVVADQKAFGVGRKGGFTGAGKTEEDSGVLAVHIRVGGAVHRSDAFKRKVIVHHREHTFLHFAAVPGVYDNLFAAGNVEHNRGFAVKTEFLVVFHLCFGRVVNYEIGFEVFEFFFRRLNEHVGYEVSLPGDFDDETYSHTSVFVRAAESVYHEQTLVRKFFYRERFNGVPRFFRGGVVVVLVRVGRPPNGVFGVVVYYDKFIFGRTTGINTRHNVYCTEFAYLTFFVTGKGRIGFFFEKKFVRRIVNYFFNARDAVLV